MLEELLLHWKRTFPNKVVKKFKKYTASFLEMFSPTYFTSVKMSQLENFANVLLRNVSKLPPFEISGWFWEVGDACCLSSYTNSLYIDLANLQSLQQLIFFSRQGQLKFSLKRTKHCIWHRKIIWYYLSMNYRWKLCILIFGIYCNTFSQTCL